MTLLVAFVKIVDNKGLLELETGQNVRIFLTGKNNKCNIAED